jgi:hypothetical protein
MLGSVVSHPARSEKVDPDAPYVIGERRMIDLVHENNVDLLWEQQVIQIGTEAQHGRMIHAGGIESYVDVGPFAKIPHGARAKEDCTPHAAHFLKLLDYAPKIDFRNADSFAALHLLKLRSFACSSSKRFA